MLDKPIDEICTDKEGKFIGVRSGTETVKAKQVIGDPSYFGAGKMSEGGKLRVVEDGKVIRAICLLKHPIPGTDDSDSVQIIIPQNQVGRRNGNLTFLFFSHFYSWCLIWDFVLDIYIAMVSSTHNVCAKDVYVAIVSTIVETDRPEQEIAPGLQLLGNIHEKYVPCIITRPYLSLFTWTYPCRFITITPLYTPVSSGETDNIFITRSYDATSHFETVVEEVHSVWKRVTGKDLELKKREDVEVEA